MARPRGDGIRIDASEVIDSLERLLKDIPLAGRDGLRTAAQVVKRRAQDLVPVKTGRLKKGIRYRVVSDDTATITASSEAGGVTREYASDVHEDLQANHPRGGQAKFLEQPVREMAGGDMQRALQQALQKAFARQMGIMGPPDIDEG